MLIGKLSMIGARGLDLHRLVSQAAIQLGVVSGQALAEGDRRVQTRLAHLVCQNRNKKRRRME
jgi:hypothetical protein